MRDLLVLTPTCGRMWPLVKMFMSFQDTATGDTQLVVVDDDDNPARHAVLPYTLTRVVYPRMPFTAKLNRAVRELGWGYRAVMVIGDDYVCESPGWDQHMFSRLPAGGGMSYPESGRRPGFPEIVMMSTSMADALGWFCLPAVRHAYADDAWRDLGEGSGQMRYCPQVRISHHHTDDDTYQRQVPWGGGDGQAYLEWRDGGGLDDCLDKIAVTKKL